MVAGADADLIGSRLDIAQAWRQLSARTALGPRRRRRLRSGAERPCGVPAVVLAGTPRDQPGMPFHVEGARPSDTTVRTRSPIEWWGLAFIAWSTAMAARAPSPASQ